MSARASLAARVAGAIGALGYLTGLVDGPIIGAVAGLALVTFGRSLAGPKGSELVGPAGFAVLAGAAGVAALRWGTLDLAEIQGAQGVLGPTIAVDPVPVAVVAGATLVAATIALGLWLTEPGPEVGSTSWWWWAELASGSLLLASLFCGPPPSDVVQTGIWLGAAIVVGALAWVVASKVPVRGPVTRLWVIGACLVVVGVAAGVAGAL